MQAAYLRTVHGTFLAASRDGRVLHLPLTDENKPFLIPLTVHDGEVCSGVLSGSIIERYGDSVRIKKDELYFCSAPGFEVVSASRASASDWETFFPIILENSKCEVIDEKISIKHALEPCAKWWGGRRLIKSEPSTSTIESCIYLPFSFSEPWGVFYSDGRPIISATTSPVIYNQRLDANIDADSIHESAPECLYYYAGRMNAHFGHFLVDTLPRFWALKKLRPNHCKILCHSSDEPEQWFGKPFIKTIFDLLGIEKDDFIVFQKPLKISRLIIPSTSLDAQSYIHEAYIDFCREIVRPIINGLIIDGNQTPIYYSKSQLAAGLSTIANESELEKSFAALGVDIVFPEQLSFHDQVRLMSERRNIIATPGSFLHTSIFCPARNMAVLCLGPEVNSNFPLIDAATKSCVSYLWTKNLRKSVSKPANFGEAWFLPNTDEIAQALLERVLNQ